MSEITGTLRGRLTLWYLASVGLIILIFLAAIGGLFWVTLQDQIDHHIHIAVTEARQIVQDYSGWERGTLIKNLVSARGMTVVVLSPDGAPILETNSPDVALVTEHQLQKALVLSSLYGSTPTHFTENNIRFAALPVQINAGKGIVGVGYSTRVLYDVFNRMLVIAVGVMLFLVLPITFGGYQLLKTQLCSLENIAEQAKAITTTSSLSKRIHIINPTQELKIIQEALNVMLAQLERIFKSEREFFSDAAHTLKTPLALLQSQIENSPLAPRPKEELLKTIDTASDATSDLLFLSRIGGSLQNSEVFSLTTVLTNLTELGATLGENKKIKVLADIQADVIFKADKKLLQRALSNLVHNAIIYNKLGGEVNLSLQEQSGRLRIVVKDTGSGIPKQDLPHVFTRFFRGSNVANKGSGLGLAISKAVIENYNGSITLESEENKGTVVTIIFPPSSFIPTSS